MILKSGNRFSDKVMLTQKISARRPPWLRFVDRPPVVSAFERERRIDRMRLVTGDGVGEDVG